MWVPQSSVFVGGVSHCVNRGRQQQAVSGEYSGRSDLLKRQTDGEYPSCVRRTRQGEAGEVVLGCYELCGCTKGRQCASTVAQCGRDLFSARCELRPGVRGIPPVNSLNRGRALNKWPFVRLDLQALCLGLDQDARTRTRLPNTVFWLWRLSPSTSLL